MNTTRIPIKVLAVAMTLCSTLLSAAPGGQPGREDERNQQRPAQVQQHKTKNAQTSPQHGADKRQHGKQAQPVAQQHSDKPNSATRSAPQSKRSHPPADLRQVENTLRGYRHEIGRGANVPEHVKITKGAPLPKGYGKRLPKTTAARLPNYEGYEWRRIGSDMVLVAVTTGLVYAIFSGVLN